MYLCMLATCTAQWPNNMKVTSLYINQQRVHDLQNHPHVTLTSHVLIQSSVFLRNFSLCPTDRQTVFPCKGIAVQLHAFLTSSLDTSELSASCCGRFTPGERAPRIRWRYSVIHTEHDGEEEMCPPRESTPGLPAPSLITVQSELSSAILCNLFP